MPKQETLTRVPKKRVVPSGNTSKNTGASNVRKTVSAEQTNNAEQTNDSQPDSDSEYYDRFSPMSIVAFILSFFGCLGIVGVILGIIDLTKKDGRKRGLSIAAIILGGIIIISSVGVGILAPQFIKYVEKQREAQDAFESEYYEDQLQYEEPDYPEEAEYDVPEDMAEFAEAEEEPEEPAESEDKYSAAENLFELFNKEAQIEETVLYDENDVRIIADSLSYGNDDAELNLTIENNSDRKLTILAGTLAYDFNAVNRVMAHDGHLSAEVEPGQSAEEKMTFSYTNLYFLGALEIAELQVGFGITDEEYNNFDTGPITIRTSLADSYDFDNRDYISNLKNPFAKMDYEYKLEHLNEGDIYNSDGVRILSEGYVINSEGHRALALEIKNDLDKDIYVHATDWSLNGEFIYGPVFLNEHITAGNRTIAVADLDSLIETALGLDEPTEEELRERGFDELDSVSMTIEVYDGKLREISEGTLDFSLE
nr:hypothetical protein [Lachnospiraceae bacterium]